jgi:head-tail adaptor
VLSLHAKPTATTPASEETREAKEEVVLRFMGRDDVTALSRVKPLNFTEGATERVFIPKMG